MSQLDNRNKHFSQNAQQLVAFPRKCICAVVEGEQRKRSLPLLSHESMSLDTTPEEGIVEAIVI